MYSDPQPIAHIPCQSVVRVRREGNVSDTVNSRAWDFFHATPPTPITPAGMDMKPINSRTNTVNYRMQPQYIPDPPRAESNTYGIASPAAAVQPPPSDFYSNPYTQRLNPSGQDARNMIRELRSAVVEDNREQQTDIDRVLAERQFYDKWLPVRAATDLGSLHAYELLRPRQDDWRTNNN